MRINKWLWAARFFKTRSLATHACELGRIHSNGQSAKPAREVKVWITLSAGANDASNPRAVHGLLAADDQMSHVQVLTVQPAALDPIPPADGSRGLQQFSHDTGHHTGERSRSAELWWFLDRK